MWAAITHWLGTAPIVFPAGVVLILMAGGGLVGQWLRAQSDRRDAAAGLEHKDNYEGYLVSAVLGLLALLIGFTFSLAVDRFETRRGLVLEEANAIGTAYLRSQMLDAPHRAQLSNLLVAYADNRLILAKARDPEDLSRLLATNDRLITDLWTATVAAFPTIRDYDFSSTYVESMNAVVDLDASRKAARQVRIPAEVFLVLFFYMVVTAGVLGYVLIGPRGRATGIFVMCLTTLALMLALDIDRPTRGGIIEGQGPMEALVRSMRVHTPSVFDRTLGPVPAPPDRPPA